MTRGISKKLQKADLRRKRNQMAAGLAFGAKSPWRGFAMNARPRLADHGASHAVQAKRRPWRARIYIAGRDVHLGYFSSAEEARAAHARAVQEHLGETYLKGREGMPA